MSTGFPHVEAACAAAAEAMALERAAETRPQQLRARHAARRASAMAVEAYGEEMLPMLFGGRWRLSTGHSDFPYPIITRGHRHLAYRQIGQTLFDHPLVYRLGGTAGPDTKKNTAIIGRPYPIAGDGKLGTFAREDADALAAVGWGCWWRPDLSTHYPGWTQLVVAKYDLQAIGAAPWGFWPIASPGLGVAAWGEWAALSPSLWPTAQ